MRLDNIERSSNLQDRRGVSKAALGGGGGLLLVGVVVALLGGDPTQFFVEGINRTIAVHTQNSNIPKAEQDKLVDFAGAVLTTTENVWHKRFDNYQEPKLTIFSGAVQSACGNAVAAMGPFYCPPDETIYLDLDFFNDLKTRHNAPGDFAAAYVLAHEVGHHIQNQLGILEQTQRLKRGPQANTVSVNTELMADCLAGIWAHDTQDLLDKGDIEEALQAASAVGDDTLQKRTRGQVVPDSFTHGSAASRMKWFSIGYKQGDINACNTFNKD